MTNAPPPSKPPCAVRRSVGAAPGAAQGQDFGFADLDTPAPEGAFAFRNLNFITPETETTCHYFWSNACNIRPITDELTDLQFQHVMKAFHQDWEVLEMQQENWDDRPVINTNADAGWLAARQMIDDFVAAEAHGRASVQAAE